MNTRTWMADEILKDQRAEASPEHRDEPFRPKVVSNPGAVSGGEKRKCPLWVRPIHSFQNF